MWMGRASSPSSRSERNTNKLWCASAIPARGCRRSRRTRSLVPSLRRSLMAPAWDCPSAAPSLNHIAAASGLPTTLRAAQVFTSFCRPKSRHMSLWVFPRPKCIAGSNRERWTAAIAQSDGFVFVPPEYNYGPSAVLKNAIDWVYPEWNRKAAAFVSYGSAMGARAVQQLRETAIEVQLAPVRSSVHIPVATLWAHYKGGDVDAGLAGLEANAGALIDDLLWWVAALKTARAGAS